MLSLLNIVEGFPINPNNNIDKDLTTHRIVEALKFAYAERTELGDPAFLSRADQERIADIAGNKSLAAEIRANISDVIMTSLIIILR